MLYIKFPFEYMLTRKSAETDWSRYETATVREKASSVEVVDIATLRFKCTNLRCEWTPVRQRGWVNCTCPTIGLDFWKRETWSVRPADAFLPKVWVSWRVGSPKVEWWRHLLFQDSLYLQHVCKWFSFKLMFQEYSEKKRRLTYLFGATQKSQEQYTCYCQRWREVTMADLTIKSCIRHWLT